MRRPAAAVLACAGLLACSPSRPGNPGPGPGSGREPAPSPAAASATPAPRDFRFRIVYVIHGDADYIYHDAAGRRRLADEDALAQAQEVARGARGAEVLIFHQRPRKRPWSAPGGMAYRYRGGALAEARAYVRSPGDPGFASEAAVFAGAGGDAPGEAADSVVRAFVYFGHEIPAAGGRGYSRSRPSEEFDLAHFVRGLENFGGPPGGPDKPFALVALSACRGGTPATTAALFPYADRLLASPTELHLSHLDTRALVPALADPYLPGNGGGAARAADPREGMAAASRRMLEESFARLQARTQAPVALALYDAEKAAAYLARAAAVPEPGAGPARAWRDCGEDPGFGPGGAEAGALVRYRAGRFGRLKAKSGHSGWECPRGGLPSAAGRGPSGT